jgi:Protein of unknown function (DUF2817)
MFSPDYATAHQRFQQSAKRAGARLESLPLDTKGPAGEQLSIDIAWLGSDNPQHIILHSSGLHGVEGFAGSAIQLQMLDQPPEVRDNSALVIVHILNPYGMSWLRRVNENNVDLNRNFLPPGTHHGAPPAYEKLDRFLNPHSPPSSDFFAMKAMYLILRHGMGALKQTVAGGQYQYPAGLFFGGTQLQDGLRQYHSFLQRRLAGAQSVLAVDVHTGLGKYAEDTLLVNAPDSGRLRSVFGKRVCAMDPERSPAYRIKGGLPDLLAGALPKARLDFLGQEFGTYNPIKVLHILREENRWHHYGAGTTDHPAKRALKEAFCPGDASWRRAVLKRGRELVDQALGYGMLAAIGGNHATFL